jgi:hypothetical protein
MEHEDFITRAEFARRLGTTSTPVADGLRTGRIASKLENNMVLVNWFTESEKWACTARKPAIIIKRINDYNKEHFKELKIKPLPMRNTPCIARDKRGVIHLPTNHGKEPAEDLDDERLDDPTEGIITNSNQSKVYYQAKLHKLEYETKIGNLISLDIIEKALQGIGLRTQKALLSIPDRTSAIIAAEEDPARVRIILINEIRIVLENLAREIDRLKLKRK